MSDAPKVGDVLVMVGTKKGSFLFWSDPARMQWQRSQHHRSWMVHHLAHDPRDNSIYAATNSGNYDGVVQRTPDFGATREAGFPGRERASGAQGLASGAEAQRLTRPPVRRRRASRPIHDR